MFAQKSCRSRRSRKTERELTEAEEPPAASSAEAASAQRVCGETRPHRLSFHRQNSSDATRLASFRCHHGLLHARCRPLIMTVGCFSDWRKLPVSLSELCINTTLRCGQSFR